MRPPAWSSGSLAGPAVLLAAGAAMLAWTWGAWPDPLIDFGRELYVAWRLAEGDALYTDVAWFNGPLSAHWNALIFRAFGPGLSVLAWSNVLVLAATVGMLYVLLAQLSDRVTATVARQAAEARRRVEGVVAGLEATSERSAGYIRKIPKVVSRIGALSAAEIPSAITLRVSTGSTIPSSQRRAVE